MTTYNNNHNKVKFTSACMDTTLLNSSTDNMPDDGNAANEKEDSFTTLPGEVRNQIYEAVVRADPPVLYAMGGGKVSVHCGLIAASKQLSAEFRAFVHQSQTLIGHVYDFKFSHIVRFIDSLTEVELNAFPMLDDGRAPSSYRLARGYVQPAVSASTRRFVIALHVTRQCPDDPTSLRLWLRRFRTPNYRGHGIAFEYTIAKNGMHAHFDPITFPVITSHRAIYPVLPENALIPGKLKAVGDRVEKEKIVVALEQGGSFQRISTIQQAADDGAGMGDGEHTGAEDGEAVAPKD